MVRQETLHLFNVLYCIVRPRKNKSISNEVTDILSTAPVTKSLQVWGCWLFQHGRNFKGKRSTILRDNSRFKHCPWKAKNFSTAVSKPASAETNTAVRQTTEGFLFVTELNQLSHTYLIKQSRFISMYILLLLVLSNSLHTKLAPVDALSFRFQLEMTMCTKVAFFSPNSRSFFLFLFSQYHTTIAGLIILNYCVLCNLIQG